jgi:hypothetical protein
VKKLILLLLVAVIGWQAYGKYENRITPTLATTAAERAPSTARLNSQSSTNYRCDGRIYCSQMTSCEEATWFLRNCPGTKMDGNNDGIPCERQWCK